MNIYYNHHHHHHHHHYYFKSYPKEAYQNIALFSPGFHTNNKIITIMKLKGNKQYLLKIDSYRASKVVSTIPHFLKLKEALAPRCCNYLRVNIPRFAQRGIYMLAVQPAILTESYHSTFSTELGK